MEQLRKHKIIQSISILAMVGAVIFMTIAIAGMVFYLVDQKEYATYDAHYLTAGHMQGDVVVEELGSIYEGNADAGYNFYRLQIPVFNTGTEEFDEYDMYVTVEGEEYDDVQEYYQSSASDFQDQNTRIVPVGQVASIPYIVQVKDGVDEFTLTWYNSSDDSYNEENGVSQTITLSR